MEFFDLIDLYIFEHLSLHIHFQALKPSYTFSWVALYFLNFFIWSTVTDQRLEIWKCDGRTNQLTWVGARDTCVSKKRSLRDWHPRCSIRPQDGTEGWKLVQNTIKYSSCGNAACKYQARIAVAHKPSQWELWRMFNNHLSCSKIKFVQMQFTRGNRKGIILYDPFFIWKSWNKEFWSIPRSTYQQWTLFCLNGPYFGP